MEKENSTDSQLTTPNENFSMDDWRQMAREHSDSNSLITIEAPEETLRELARDPDTLVRRGIAHFRNMPEDALCELADDFDFEVRRKVAGNPHTPVDVLRKLAYDPDTLVRKEVAANNRTPEDTLHELVKDVEPEVRNGIAWNACASEDVLKELADSGIADDVYIDEGRTMDKLNNFEALLHIKDCIDESQAFQEMMESAYTLLKDLKADQKLTDAQKEEVRGYLRKAAHKQARSQTSLERALKIVGF